MKATLAIIALTLVPFFAHADADLDKVRADEKTCLDQNMSEVGMKMCEGQTYEAADKILNATYQKIVVPLQKSSDAGDRETLKRLVTAEKAWITFRDAECSYEGTPDLGGSNEGLDILGCEVDTTIARIKSLRNEQ